MMATSANEKYHDLRFLLVEKKGIPIHTLLKFFIALNEDEFNFCISEILQKDTPEVFEQLVYYLTLFREIPQVQSLLGNNNLSIEILEHMILFSYTRANVTEQAPEDALDNVVFFLNQDRYLDLLLKSQILSHDRLVSYYLLTKLDRKHIDMFFNQKEDLNLFLDGFMRLPEETVRSILVKNPDLFGYISLFLQTLQNAKASEFIQKHEFNIHEMDYVKKLISHITSHIDVEKERLLPLPARNTNRIAYIVKKIKDQPHIDSILQTMLSEGVIIDKEELELVKEIIQNPMFKMILMRFSYLPDGIIRSEKQGVVA